MAVSVTVQMLLDVTCNVQRHHLRRYSIQPINPEYCVHPSTFPLFSLHPIPLASTPTIPNPLYSSITIPGPSSLRRKIIPVLPVAVRPKIFIGPLKIIGAVFVCFQSSTQTCLHIVCHAAVFLL